ncbi:MAG: bifunctional folylpolyglutamate synthase/dihydrofolate synthase [Alphaproteobacteria bacterium]|nr:bifunctional folylpolyglutamate synthase/dihydrofolate synthase [Alphaproteobacteria bacterium]
MADTAQQIADRFHKNYRKDLGADRRAYRALLKALGNPQDELPPVFHVAGTNGKGSVCAFLRAMLEAAGYKVHVYTSPHLIEFRERIRVAGEIISEPELAKILSECERLAEPGAVSYFEAATAAALVAFARHPADYCILEVGIGGRLDATNIIARPLATFITRLSFDHREMLGETIDAIAREKAGIMRPGVPCYALAQGDPLARQTLYEAASGVCVPLLMENEAWKIEETATGFRFSDTKRNLDLPAPALQGRHQYHNAGLAIAALPMLTREQIAQGLRNVEWPGRLQRITGKLAAVLPLGSELWLDGGHNDSAGEILADQLARWRQEDPKPLFVILGMLTTKHPGEFLKPFADQIAYLRTIAVPEELLSFAAGDLAAEARLCGVKDAAPAAGLHDALAEAARQGTAPRILICGSLYLAGMVLKEI